MKAAFPWLGAILCAAGAATSLHANPYPPWQPTAPDACWPGFYNVNYWGGQYGPNYYLRPPFPPFNGMLPNVPPGGNAAGMGGAAFGPGAGMNQCPGGPGYGNNGGTVVFPSHPFARSPRDYFMLDQ